MARHFLILHAHAKTVVFPQLHRYRSSLSAHRVHSCRVHREQNDHRQRLSELQHARCYRYPLPDGLGVRPSCHRPFLPIHPCRDPGRDKDSRWSGVPAPPLPAVTLRPASIPETISELVEFAETCSANLMSIATRIDETMRASLPS